MPKDLLLCSARNTIVAATMICVLLPAFSFAEEGASVVVDPRINSSRWDPPEKYVGKFPGILTVKTLPPDEIHAECVKIGQAPATDEPRGCARWWPNPMRCTIVAIDRPAYGTNPAFVIWHEIAHCGPEGWPNTHPE